MRGRIASGLTKDEFMVSFYERPDGSIYIHHPEVDEEAIDAFILNYRLLQQKNDCISVRAIGEAISSVSPTTYAITAFTDARARLNQLLEEAFLPKDIVGVSNREFLDCMLYGVFAHTEIEKLERVLAWRERVPEDVLRTCFIALIHHYIDILSDLRKIAEQISIELK